MHSITLRLPISFQQEVGDGPVPWCSPDQLSFVAEQVSHHPPISAFYAEHVNKRIQFDAWVWTKSKFLGLSIGVHNIGRGLVTLLDLGEEYTLTFPNGYGRLVNFVSFLILIISLMQMIWKTFFFLNSIQKCFQSYFINFPLFPQKFYLTSKFSARLISNITRCTHSNYITNMDKLCKWHGILQLQFFLYF